jgi:hypothetical protein
MTITNEGFKLDMLKFVWYLSMKHTTYVNNNKHGDYAKTLCLRLTNLRWMIFLLVEVIRRNELLYCITNNL